MYKNERINIKPLQNGYLIDHEYREDRPTKTNPENWDYVSKEYMFATWDKVAVWVKDNPLTMPPAKTSKYDL